jgi:hypothetical protein
MRHLQRIDIVDKYFGKYETSTTYQLWERGAMEAVQIGVVKTLWWQILRWRPNLTGACHHRGRQVYGFPYYLT